MNGTIRKAFVVLAACAAYAIPIRTSAGPPAGSKFSLPAVAANDNTLAGGKLERGVLRLSLVARRGLFYPDGPGTMGLPIEAFGEVGKPLQIPGPFLHVSVGTRIDATIRNELDHELTVRGLGSFAERLTSFVRIRANATRRVSFRRRSGRRVRLLR